MEPEANDKPQVYTTTTKEVKSKKFSFRDNMGKILLGVFVVALLFEVGYFYKNWQSSLPKVEKIQALSEPTLALTADKKSFKVGENVAIKVRLATGGLMVDSVDTVIKYDPKMLEATSSTVQTGKIFTDYPIIDVNSSTGTIRIASITQPDREGFVGVGTLATLQLKAKAQGNTNLSFDFKKGPGSNTNTIKSDSEMNVLGTVANLDLSISNAASSDKETAKKTCTGYVQYCNNLFGQTGRQLCNGGVITNNECGFDISETQSCGPCKLGR